MKGLLAGVAFVSTLLAQPQNNAPALTDGKLHVILCGTGSPLPDPDRAGSCTAIVAAGQVILIDVGPGSWRKAMLSGVPGPMLSAVLLTHYHSDHIGDLGEALTMSWANGRNQPLDVYGPPGVDQIVDGVNREYRLDEDYRVTHHTDAVVPRKAHDAVPHAVNVADDHSATLVFEKNGLKIFAFQVDHRPIVPAYGYRVEYAGRAVVISGDTSYSENVVRNAKDADLLIHDAMVKDLVSRAAALLDVQGQARTAKMMRDILTYHASTLDAAKTAAQAHVGTLVLSHLVPVPANIGGTAPFLQGVAAIFSGKVEVAKDGMRFDFDPKHP